MSITFYKVILYFFFVLFYVCIFAINDFIFVEILYYQHTITHFHLVLVISLNTNFVYVYFLQTLYNYFNSYSTNFFLNNIFLFYCIIVCYNGTLYRYKIYIIPIFHILYRISLRFTYVKFYLYYLLLFLNLLNHSCINLFLPI